MKSSELNVLHINFADNSGGAARSAYKIHSGLRQRGLGSRMLVRLKVTEDPDVDFIYSRRPLVRIGDLIGKKIIDRLSLPYLYNPSSFELLNHPWFKSADVVQLYNIHALTCFFTYRALPKISSLKPVVWRLSDMWPFTGHCAYAHECDRWKTGCGNCPYLHEYPALTWDTTALLWRIKKEVYQRSRLVIVTTNSWMENLVTASPLLGHLPIYCIPNGIDTTKFSPVAQNTARKELGIPVTANVVLFAAYDTTETRKGGQYIPSVMEKVASSGIQDLTLVIMGKGAESFPDCPGFKTIRLKFSDSDRLLANVYSAADLFLHPAIVENFPNSILESMACATPCIAFSTGGVGDVLRHLETGYLAKYKDVENMAEGVKLLLEDAELRSRLSQNCRTVVESEYTLEIQAQRHAQLYQELLEAR